jgi:uroporphyrinogen-III synthase
MPGTERALAGLRVLVTRPVHQAAALCRLIEQSGGVALRYPTIEIAAPDDVAALVRIVAQLDQYALAVFVSPNAVSYGLEVIRRHGPLPSQLAIACLGAGSARALAEHGITDVLTPARRESEGLLALAPLQQLAGKRVVIFRGVGGRELLAETLRARGAHVDYAECYRRLRPRDGGALEREFLQRRVDIVTVTSADALRNLFELVGALALKRLQQTPLVVVSTRLTELAHELGHTAALSVAAEPSDEAIVAAVATLGAACGAGEKHL